MKLYSWGFGSTKNSFGLIVETQLGMEPLPYFSFSIKRELLITVGKVDIEQVLSKIRVSSGPASIIHKALELVWELIVRRLPVKWNTSLHNFGTAKGADIHLL